MNVEIDWEPKGGTILLSVQIDHLTVLFLWESPDGHICVIKDYEKETATCIHPKALKIAASHVNLCLENYLR